MVVMMRQTLPESCEDGPRYYLAEARWNDHGELVHNGIYRAGQPTFHKHYADAEEELNLLREEGVRVTTIVRVLGHGRHCFGIPFPHQQLKYPDAGSW